MRKMFIHIKKLYENGEHTLFWEDVWIGQKPIREIFPRLYFLTFTVNVSVKFVISGGWGVIHFRRNIFGVTARMCGELKEICEDVTLNNKQDKCVGMLEKMLSLSTWL
jgi:hypothetical protein